MKFNISLILSILFATAVVSIAGDKDTVQANEKAAWQAFKDKNADAFKKVVDKDLRCVYPEGIMTFQNELDDMKNWDIKSFTFSDYQAFTDEPDVIVTTYKVDIQGTYQGKDVSGTYNSGSVWKKEKNAWLAIFHTNILAQGGTSPAASP